MGLSGLVLACVATPPQPENPSAVTGGPASAAAPAASAGPGIQASGRRELSLLYEAPATCPEAQSYMRQVESRAATLSIALQRSPVTPANATAVSVSLSETPEGWAGNLDIADAEGLHRSVRGDRCEDVVEALALITVLRLEPSAGRDERTATGSGDARGPSAGVASSSEARATLDPGGGARASPPVVSAPGAPEASGGAAPVAAEEPANAGAGVAAADPSEPAASPRERDPSASTAIEGADAPLASRANIAAVPPPPSQQVARGEIEGAVPAAVAEPEPIVDTPDAEPDTSAPSSPWSINVVGYLGYAAVPSNALELSLQAELPLGTEPGWAASVIASYVRGSEQNARGSGVFNLWTARAQLCGPALVEPVGWLQPCAAVRAGLLQLDISAGAQTLDAPGATQPWAALGPGFQAGVPLASRWSLRVLGELSFLLVRDSFDVARTIDAGPGAPDDAVELVRFYRPPALSFDLGIGLGYTF